MNRATAILCLGLLEAWPLAARCAPVRLGIVLAHPESAEAGDLLTAGFSKLPDVQLLERADIDKVYREQALSAQYGDFIKLGQILAADGLLEVDVVQANEETKLSARLMAVKPGVVLLAQSFSWANPSRGKSVPLTGWAPLFVKRVEPLLPKLHVLDKEAIPISIVNFRSAMQSAAGMEEERAIKLLLMERLSREPRLFVLERQRLGSLADEKELKRDDSAFWNGSYLLDGTLDASGYSASAMTVSARLTPPKGAAPVQIEISASRTNLAQVTDQLAAKIIETLQLPPLASEWKPTDEASQFLAESRWALKWNLYPQAQAAAESAWALGRRDMECAAARVCGYMLPIQKSNNSTDSFDLTAFTASARQDPPTSQEADDAQRALESYLQFSRTLDTNDLELDSAWVKLGIEALTSASHHLQRFWAASQEQKAFGDMAAGLRASVRSVAKWMADLPCERRTFYLAGQIPIGDQMMHDFDPNLNIFRCELQWGCFWQERPEDMLALYRELMTGPHYPCIQAALWFRLPGRPRLVAWNHESAAQQPALWKAFLGNLNASTNPLLVMEGKALVLADAKSSGHDESQVLEAGVDFFDYALSNFDAIVAANEQLLYLNWRLDRFGTRWGFYGEGAAGAPPGKWELDFGWHQFYRRANTNAHESQTTAEDRYNYAPRLIAARQEYTTRNSERLKEFANARAFERLKAFLAGFVPYDFFLFCKLCDDGDYYGKEAYSKAQAAQLLPLIQAYESNLLARASTGDRHAQFKAKSDSDTVEHFLGSKLRAILNGPEIPAHFPVGFHTHPPPKPPEPRPTNIVVVKDFHPPPRDPSLAGAIVNMLGPSWSEGRLLMGLEYESWRDAASQGGRPAATLAVAIFDPDHDSWQIVRCPRHRDAARPPEYLPNIATNRFASMAEMMGPCGAPFALLGDHLFLSVNGRFDEYDFHTRQWTNLNLPNIQDARLFIVNKRLFAANQESILEVIPEAQSSRLLASVRRRPSQSLLDTMDRLNHPVLFPGPNQSLRLALDHQGIFAWNGTDWMKQLPAPYAAQPAGEGMFFRSESGLWLLGEESSKMEYCFDNQWRPRGFVRKRPPANPVTAQMQLMEQRKHQIGPMPHPTDTVWVAAAEEPLTFVAGTAFQSNLYFLVDHSRWAAQDGYDTKLVCLQRGSYEPKFIPLKFAAADGAKASSPGGLYNLGSNWLRFVGNRLFISSGGSPGFWTVPIANLPSDPPEDTGG